MATFGKSTFSAAAYAAFRPSYPPSLFRTVLAYHNRPASSPPGTLIDIGCGHGLISRELSPHFSKVYGIDPSEGMVRQATQTTTTEHANVTFRRGGAEDLSFLADGSVEMAVAGQAAHWFSFDKAWPELARVVRPGGTLAFWGYKDNIVLGHPEVNEIYGRFVYGDEIGVGMEGLDRYWEKPGRDILRGNLASIVPPARDWGEVKRIVYDPDRSTSQVGEDDERAWLRRRLKLGEMESYYRTYSAYRAWKDAHPEKMSRDEGGEGDIIDLMFDEMRNAVSEWAKAGESWRDITVDAVWATVIFLAKRL